MLIRRKPRFAAREITDPKLYLSRRELIAGAAVALVATPASAAAPAAPPLQPLSATRNGQLSVNDTPTKYEAATTYNNFYEFGVNKDDPSRLGHTLRPRPWTVQVDGFAHKPKTFDIDELTRRYPAEERIYRLRCVEAWSMVIPWNGFPLAALLKDVEPTSQAKYVAFTTVLRPAEMPGQKTGILPWPYVEGLRLDEAMHPLTLLVTGLYGKPLPNQDGAPIRLVVPWKYGFKGIKAIVKIRLTRTQPPTTWNIAAPDEYGFYANVNPNVDHPRWTQARERRLGEFLRRPTLMFNGYGDQVASLYTGMDLRANY